MQHIYYAFATSLSAFVYFHGNPRQHSDFVGRVVMNILDCPNWLLRVVCDEIHHSPPLWQVLDVLESTMSNGGNVVDYHGCDFFPKRWFDAVFILRTDNTILYDRLEQRYDLSVTYTQKLKQDSTVCNFFVLPIFFPFSFAFHYWFMLMYYSNMRKAYWLKCTNHIRNILLLFQCTINSCFFMLVHSNEPTSDKC